MYIWHCFIMIQFFLVVLLFDTLQDDMEFIFYYLYLVSLYTVCVHNEENVQLIIYLNWLFYSSGYPDITFF